MSNEIEQSFDANKANIQKPQTKADNIAAERYLKEIREFENDRVAIAKANAKTAWKVAGGFGAIAILAVIALVGLTPLKRIENYMWLVDPQTGITHILKPMTDTKKISYGEVLDKFWINRFITERNSYDWKLVQHSYNTVKLMTNAKVFNAYAKAIRAKDSPLEVFGEKNSVITDVNSISFLPNSSTTQKLAQVHFTRQVVSSSGELSSVLEPTKWSATITFDYLSEIKTEDERKLNPLGFQVTSYREDRITVQ